MIFFALIVVLLAIVAMMEYARSAQITRIKVEKANEYYANTGTVFDKEASLSRLRKRIAFAYLVLILFHSAVYTSLHLS